MIEHVYVWYDDSIFKPTCATNFYTNSLGDFFLVVHVVHVDKRKYISLV